MENAVAQILEQIYEPKFYNESYGFRPNRGCHQAGREVIEMIQYHKMNHVVEADIWGFFDNIDHDWLMQMLRHDIEDRRFLEVVGKFLKAGVMENGKYLDRGHHRETEPVRYLQISTCIMYWITGLM